MAGDDFNALDAVNIGIENEKSGHSFYTAAAAMTSDPHGKEMFTKLANDELAHLYWLMTVRQSLLATGSFDPEAQKEAEEKGKGVANAIFPRPATAKAGVKVDTRELDALRRGIDGEKRAVALYREAAEKTTDASGKALFAKLAEWEEDHIRLLEAEYDYITNTGLYFGVSEFILEGPEYLTWWRRKSV
ncbi:MAG: ferritin family protein [Chloroflexi bacterium]|nr:ferritin family protein [Chloroflexota bacterium]